MIFKNCFRGIKANFRSFFLSKILRKSDLFLFLLILYIFSLLNQQNAQVNFHNGQIFSGIIIIFPLIFQQSFRLVTAPYF